MKKLFSLVLIILVVAGCNKEKIYKENLEGVWQVYKYLLNNTDKTVQFQNENPNYTITFTQDGKFSELRVNPDSVYVNGSYSFADNDEKIVLDHTYFTYTITVDTNGLPDTLTVSHPVERKYTIFNLTRDHVQLRNDTSQLYMNKVK